jgi:lactoylglutathione lyase
MPFNARDHFEKVHHLGFIVQDIDRTLDFYIKKLGFELFDRWTEPPEEAAMGMGVPGASLELCQVTGYGCMLEFIRYMTSPGSAEAIMPNHIGVGHASFLVKDLGSLIDNLKKEDVKIASPIVRLPASSWVHIIDPDGIRIELMEFKQ